MPDTDAPVLVAPKRALVLPGLRTDPLKSTWNALVKASGPEQLRPDLDVRAMVKSMLGEKATKRTVRVIAEGLLGYDEHGRSTYSRTIEGLRFAVLCKDLPGMQPDRLIRLIESALTWESSYAPAELGRDTPAQLATITRGMQDDRVEDVLTDLGRLAHSGRWFDHVAAAVPIGEDDPILRGNIPNGQWDDEGDDWDVDDDDPDGGLAHGADVWQGWLGHRGYIADHLIPAELRTELDNALAAGGPLTERQLLIALVTNRLNYCPEHVELVQATYVSPGGMAKIGKTVAATADPDSALLWASHPSVSPASRPISPINGIVAELDRVLRSLRDPAGHDPIRTVARTWLALYPPAVDYQYPLPERSWMLDGYIENPGDQQLRVEVITSPHMLRRNAQQMGNCTGGYHQRLRAGNGLLVRIYHEGQIYNAGFGNDRYRAEGDFVVYEVNSRFNRGNVPEAVRTMSNQIAAHLNATITLAA